MGQVEVIGIMPLPSYSDVFNITHERLHDEEIRQGDLVRMGQNHFPQYRVVAVYGEKAWVRNEHSGEDHIALIARCRQIDA